MKLKFRLLIFLSALILLLTFILPLWKIGLEAPQYPEGIGFKIYLSNIRGETEHDLNKINGLNHYIGMKTIEPELIPELKLMPYIIIFMVILGIFAGIFPKKYLLMAWIIIFIIIGLVGLYDFYMWEYDYGHNLSPMAIIKIPDMSYQPPLIGSKQLLNFNAISLPDTGMYIILASIFINTFVLLSGYRKKVNKKT